MWIVFVIAASFFAAILAMGYFAVRDVDWSADAPAGAGAGADDSCAVCEGTPPARPATSDEVVFEVERHIDAELREIAHALHAHPGRLGRNLQA